MISDNIANAIAWSGEVYQSIAAEVYNTPRIMRTLGRDGTDGEQQLFKTVLDDETGRTRHVIFVPNAHSKRVALRNAKWSRLACQCSPKTAK